MTPTRPRCPKCAAPNDAGQDFCGKCGADLRAGWHNPAFPRYVSRPKGQESSVHFILKWGLALWAIAFPVVSCAPLFATGTETAGGAAVGGLASMAVGATLFGPWIVGLLVLGVLVLVTK